MSDLGLWTPGPGDLARVEQFVQDYYQKEEGAGSALRGDLGPRRLEQTKLGKLPELAWSGLTGGEVDWSIWPVGATPLSVQQAPDITSTEDNPVQHPWDQYRLHVKSCRMDLFGGPWDSWTVSTRDSIYRTPAHNDLILLSYCDPDSGDVIKLGVVLAVDVMRFWKPCASRKLVHKRAIYHQDIAHLIAYL